MSLFKRLLIIFTIIIIALIFLGYLNVYSNYTVPILTYHSINNEYLGPPTVNIVNFENQIRYLKENNFNVISLNELVEGIKAKKKFAHNTVVITFDDGLEDNYTNAYPILRNYDLPATIFLISDFVGIKPEYLNWQEAQEMLTGKINFGSHTKTHAYLPELIKNEFFNEIKGSKEQIEANINQEILFLSYPAGGFSEEIKNIVNQAGFKAACTTNRGFDKNNRDLFELKRIKVTDKDGDNLLKFRAKLSGYYNIFRSSKNPY